MTRQTLAKPAPAPDLAPVTPAAPPQAAPRRAMLARALDRVVAHFSIVPDEAVLDVRRFAWTADLRREWRAIAAEASAVAPQVGRWRTFRLWEAGVRIDANVARCPETAALTARIPGLEAAFFSVLAPGVHVPERRGATKALVTCHLGLTVPRDGDVRMRVGDRVIRWAEGETLVFDDTRPHAIWNDAAAPRAVLVIRFARPLRRPGTWLADAVLRLRRRSARESKGFRPRA